MSQTTDNVNRQEVLKVLGSLVFRAEKQVEGTSNLDTYVRPVDFAALSSSNTQIIYGRNGTGKTHLLRAFYKYCEQNFEEQKVLPVYIDMRDLDLGPVLPSISVDELIVRFYQRFMRKVIERLTEFARQTVTSTFLGRVFGSAAAGRQEGIRTTLEGLKKVLNLEDIEERVKEYVRKVELSKEGSSDIKAGLGLSGRLSLTKPMVKIDSRFGMGAQQSEREKETLELVYGGLAVIDYERLRKGLEELVELCGARAIIILVDEWSSASPVVQPLLAEMIRKTLGSSSRVFLKIVALKFYTQTSLRVGTSSQPVGLQPGVDIATLADLDELLNCDADTKSVSDFLTAVAHKHAAIDLPALKSWSVRQFQEYLYNEVFDAAATFLDLVRSSEGNPRDFLTILTSCCAENPLGESKVSGRVVTRAAVNNFSTSKAQTILPNEPGRRLFEKLFQRVVSNRSKLFLISASKAEVDERLRLLWHYRFIHLVCERYPVLSAQGLYTEYAIYSMDYGKLLTLKVQREGEKIFDTVISLAESLTQAGPLGTYIAKSLGKIIKSTELGTQLIRAAGRHFVDNAGTQGLDIANTEELVPKLVVDDLL